MLCPKCNQPVGENDGFCSHCGCSLAERRQEVQTVYDASTKNGMGGDGMMDMPKTASPKKEETLMERFFSADGRLNRKPYIIRLLILNLVALCIEVFGILTGVDAAAGGFIKFVQFILVTVPGIMLMIRRLHDLNRTGWLWLLCFIPLINLALIVYVLAFKGTTGPNRFGPDPLE